MSGLFQKWLKRSRTATIDLSTSDLGQLRAGLDYGQMKNAIRLGHQRADLGWKKAYYALRIIWATLAIILLGASLWFTYWLVNGVGTKQLDFSQNENFLNIIAGEIIINVLGLVAIVMHFLFPQKGDPKNGVKK